MKIDQNCMVTLRLRVSLADGTLVDDGAEPVTYVHGGYQDIFEAIERQLHGKSTGDRLDVTLKPEDAFGAVDESLCQFVPLEHFPTPPRPGDQVERQTDGTSQLFTVQEVSEDRVFLDGNHPLAGQQLAFQAQILDVRPATPEEVMRAARAVHVTISRWRAFKAVFTSYVAAPVMLLLVTGLTVEWLGSGILAYGALALGLAVLAAVLWKGLDHLRDLWRGGQMLSIDTRGIQWRDFPGVAAWGDIARIRLDSFGTESGYIVTLADNREFRIEASTLSLDTAQISWLLAQYLPAAKLDGV